MTKTLLRKFKSIIKNIS